MNRCVVIGDGYVEYALQFGTYGNVVSGVVAGQVSGFRRTLLEGLDLSILVQLRPCRPSSNHVKSRIQATWPSGYGAVFRILKMAVRKSVGSR